MKYLKLVFIAVILIGAVSLLVLFTQSGGEGTKAGVKSSCAKKFEREIIELCKDGKWTQQGYKNLDNKINTFAKDGNIQIGEKNSLCLFLYTESCKSLFESADKMFKLSTYPTGKVSSLESSLKFLESLKAGSNSNLTQGLSMFHEYRTLLACCSFSSNATYSNPLKAFNGGTAESIKGKIHGMKYYNSHFSNNPTIRAKIDNLASNLSRAESEYYMNLEKCVEANFYKIKNASSEWQALEQTDRDYERFKVISTNQTATSKLQKFLNGNH